MMIEGCSIAVKTSAFFVLKKRISVGFKDTLQVTLILFQVFQEISLVFTSKAWLCDQLLFQNTAYTVLQTLYAVFVKLGIVSMQALCHHELKYEHVTGDLDNLKSSCYPL